MRVLLGLLVGLMPGLAQARESVPPDPLPGTQCVQAAETAGLLEGIPEGLMSRLARVESGRQMPGEVMRQPWPWTINADGTDIVFPTKGEAVAWAASAPQRGVRFLDAGCLQVNLQYHPNAFADLEEAFDPRANALYAARYLRSLYEESGHDWSIAVGWYHSHTPELAYEYRARVGSLGEGIIAGLPPGPLAARMRAIGLVRVPLAGGGVVRIQVNRQPVGRRPVRASPCAVAAAIAPLMARPLRVEGCGRSASPARVAARVIGGP